MAEQAIATPAAAEPDTGSGRVPNVVLDDVHVTYRVYEDRKASMRQIVSDRFKPRSYREIHAVRGVSLTAYSGEAIGVIGANGSGKSTLLRAIAGLLPVTGGAVYARTEPALLGVDAALQPALSGRRNIELGGLALGMTRKELEARFDDIVEFSGLADAINLPLRTYSSGMRARLHFSIATSVFPEILLIDEALSVGDEDFRQRSEARIRELQEAAGTIFLVTHSLASVRETCARAIWLDRGQVREDGAVDDVVSAYKASVKKPERKKRKASNRRDGGKQSGAQDAGEVA